LKCVIHVNSASHQELDLDRLRVTASDPLFGDGQIELG
jgi:hypothetical protein